MLSCVEDFALNVASLSYRGNIHRLQRLFRTIKARVVRLGISFSFPKTELIHWRPPSQRPSQWCLLPIQLDVELIHPRDSLRWLGYWFTPTMCTSAYFSCLVLAQGGFALIRRLSPPGAGVAPTCAPDWHHRASYPSSFKGRNSSRPTQVPSSGSPSGTRCRGGPPIASHRGLLGSWLSRLACPPTPFWSPRGRAWPPSGQSVPHLMSTPKRRTFSPPSHPCAPSGPRISQGPTPEASHR